MWNTDEYHRAPLKLKRKVPLQVTERKLAYKGAFYGFLDVAGSQYNHSSSGI